MDGRYDWSGLYHDADDPRLFVPKRIPALGWTINVEHPFGRTTLALIVIVPLGCAVIGIAAALYRR